MYKTSDFNYYLPEELIAQTPCEPRDASRLLVYSKENKTINHKHFYDIESMLGKGDVLVINNTKVLPARMHAKTVNGGDIEILLLKRESKNLWEVLVKPGKKAKEGAVLTVGSELKATVVSRTESGGRIINFEYSGVFEDILSRVGTMPLPPYIKERLKEQSRYQTVYCKTEGSSAAPTAGLHFTPQLLQRLKEKGVIITEVLLHVGLGTFRPVKAENITEHVMHSEYYSVSDEAVDIINLAKKEKRRVIAVGTTSVRTLESTADENGFIKACHGDTNIFIYPPYRFKCVDALITNFHLPESTLVMLVSAFAGKDETLSLYKTAVSERYRFFSFGDAMFIY